MSAVQAADLIHRARGHERAGCVVEAMDCYRKAVDEAARSNVWGVEAEALRASLSSTTIAASRKPQPQPARAASRSPRRIATTRSRQRP